MSTLRMNGDVRDQTPPELSTRRGGPRTAEGKAKSSMNAKKHGFSAKQKPYLADAHLQNSLAQELPSQVRHLAQPISQAFATLRHISNMRFQLIQEVDLSTTDSYRLKKLVRRLVRLGTYERRADTRLSRAIVQILVSRATLARTNHRA